MAKRDGYFDTLKFTLILLVIFGHAIVLGLNNSNIIKGLYVFIYTFHMPLFIFVSGYFSKKMTINKINEFTLRFIEIYIVCQFIWFVLEGGVLEWIHEVPSFNEVWSSIKYYIIMPYGYLWYIISLVFWKYMVFFTKKINSKILLLISFTASFLIGFIDFNGGILSISRTISFFPFFLLGYYCTKEHIDIIRSRKRLIYLIIPIVAFILSFSPYCLKYPRVEELSYGKYAFSYFNTPDWLDFIVRIGFIVAAIAMSIVFMMFCKSSKFFLKYGEKTLLFYIYHLYILWILKRIMFKTFGMDINIITLSIQAILTIIVLMVMSRFKIFEVALNPISSFINRQKSTSFKMLNSN